MPPGNARHLWKIVVSVALAVALFAYFLSRAHIAEVGRSLARANLLWALASLLAALGTYVLRSLRWGLILRPVGRVRPGTLIGCTSAGFATSTVLPARAGEIVRPLLLTARTGLPAAATLASILTERLLDGASVLILFATGVAFASAQMNAADVTALRDAALLTTTGLVGAIALVWFLLRRREAAVARVSGWLPVRFRARAASFANHLLDGLEVLRSPLRLAEIAAWSLALWLLIGFQLALLARAFAFHMSLGQAFVVVAVSVVGLAVPTPAGVGGFHAAIQFGLAHLMGVDLATATAYALIHHAICFFPITAVGLGYLGSVGFSLGRVRELEERAAPGAEAG
ncbi:MAG TPA: lysylphosphatidylglycerol synthase transmembrane domain-containing protein [Thermoanaerobaculaceae bacterium]|nr:lysylphosphatidylglycerol synthase transmembrane domain-containing protein [Thermoanaerobaculaceae bacterium]